MAYVQSKRKEATPEQKEAAKARRDVISNLGRKINQMSEEQRLAFAADHPIVTCEGHQLSPFNCCLVISQQADATVVGGFQQWRKVGRRVKKGGRSVGMFVHKGERGEEGSSSGVPHSSMYEWLMVSVFDITQTEEL